MFDNYFNFLDYRATQRRLAAKFAHPRGMLLHVMAFVTTMTLIWIYGLVWRLWFHRDNFIVPVIAAFVWSLFLALHALVHYRRSAAFVERRELAIEDEMRRFVEKNGDDIPHDTLFDIHQGLESDLVKQGRWSLALLAFSMVNVVSWAVSIVDMGTSWGMQTVLPLAILIIGGVNLLMHWQHQRQTNHKNWFVRLPLTHMIAYGFGVIGLWLLGAYRLINYWDGDRLMLIWGIVLLIHIVVNVVVLPLVKSVLPASNAVSQEIKRKPATRLMLTDDGEVLDTTEEVFEQFQSNVFHAGTGEGQ